MKNSHGILIKKKYGQHFLQDQLVADHMIENVTLTNSNSVFEIGGGEGFLTRTILRTSIARLWVFEIDPDWALYLKKNIKDDRLKVFEQNFLDIDFAIFEPHKPWTVLSNLPYQVTFPILHLLVKHRHLLKEGVLMMQEEVAQKILKTGGRGYGFVSLFFQYYFEWKKLDKVPPTAFIPPPKVFSRLLYFKPKQNLIVIPDEEKFWEFIKLCFHQPRRTLKNNLAQIPSVVSRIPAEILKLRAQQLSFSDLLNLWKSIGTI